MRPGDEPLGLAAALLEMGVGAVAPIRDEVAARVGRRLHEHLVAGVLRPLRCPTWSRQRADGGVAPLVVWATAWPPSPGPVSGRRTGEPCDPGPGRRAATARPAPGRPPGKGLVVSGDAHAASRLVPAPDPPAHGSHDDDRSR